MKFFALIFTLLLSSQAFAHHDHTVGDSALHLLYHAIFWGGFAFVAVRLMSYFMNKKKQKNNN